MCLILSLEAFTVVSATAFPSVFSANERLKEGTASGYRANGSGALTNVGSNGNYWSFAPYSQTYARNLNFNSGNVNPSNNNNRANGFAVRPSRESYKAYSRMGRYSFSDIHNLVTTAYLKAREHERNTPTQLAFEINQEAEIFSLALELHQRAWKPAPLDWFVLTDPSVREVFAPQFRDRVVSHVLFNLLSPVFERYFIHDSYSCRTGRGTLFGIERFEHHLRSVTRNYTRQAWCLSLDISGYFMSIDRNRLYTIIWDTLGKHQRRHPDWMDYDFADYLISAFLYRDPLEGCIYHGNPNLKALVLPEKSLRGKPAGTGLPIGDVINQLNSNVYLNPFDHFVKRELKIRSYCRYVDDAKMLHTDKGYLAECKDRCAEFLRDKLGLRLHDTKTTITSANDECAFLGAIIRPHRRYAKNKAISRFGGFVDKADNALRASLTTRADIRYSLNSYLGYLGKFRCRNIVAKTLRGKGAINGAFLFTRNYSRAIIKN